MSSSAMPPRSSFLPPRSSFLPPRSSSSLRFLVLAVLLGVVLPVQAAAPEPILEVTWPELLRRLDAHPLLQAEVRRVDAARAEVEAAGGLPTPTLESSLGQGRARLGEETRAEWGLGLTLPLDWLVARGPRLGAARAEVAAAAAEGAWSRRQLRLRLHLLFLTTVAEQDRLAALRELEAETTTLVELLRRRVALGQSRPIEATHLELELERLAGEVEAATIGLAAVQAELARWMGAPPGVTCRAVAAPDSWPRSPPALASRPVHPALTAAQARVEALTAALEVEQRGAWPTLAVTAFASGELDRTAQGLGLTLELPLTRWTAAPHQAAAARLAAGRAQAEAVAFELETELRQAEAACRSTVALATRLETRTLPRARAAAATLETTYLHGEVGLLEWIDARRTLLEVRRQQLAASAQAQLDCARLAALHGAESP